MSAALTAPAAVLAWGHGPWGGGHWGGGPWFLFGPLLWVVVIAAVAFLTRRAGLWGPRKGRPGGSSRGALSGWSGWGESQPAPQPSSSAEDILADRFARGEIDEAEYQDRLSTLRASR